MQKLKRKIINPQDLTTHLKQKMFQLMESHYANVYNNIFEKDLSEKNSVILLFDETENLVGFSTQMYFTHYFDDHEINVIFSGDTIIQKDYWGSNELSLGFVDFAFSILKEQADKRLFWMLISKGVRTYKYLPVFFNEFYPNCKNVTPAKIKKLMDELGYKKFPDSYVASSGIIKAGDHGQFLKPDFQPPVNPKNPHTAFFHKMNPGYASGDELLCLAEFSNENLNSSFRHITKMY